ncbi:MAG: tyrosine-protein phosphatase [Trueperaceae bacterium]|nr:tyrosine-protein phosphatase [Trueperaceae bacterium]
MSTLQAIPRGRFVPLCGTCNARDLGGLPLARGGETARGRIFRADAPLRREDGDLVALRQLGITTVIDLREPEEIALEPNALAAVEGISVHGVDVWGPMRAARTPPFDPWDLPSMYVAAIDHAGAAFARAVDLLAAAEGAVLFHCTVGKDRTGLVAALLLEALGVPRSAVVQDYALTHDRIDGVRARLLARGERHGVRREDYLRVLGATPEVLMQALRHVDDRFSGAESYLLRAGADPGSLPRLAERLTP